MDRTIPSVALRRRLSWDDVPARWWAAGVVVAVLVVVVGLVRLNPTSASDPVFTSPRQGVTWTLAQQMAETGRPVVVDPALEELPGDLGPALTPRDAASLGDEILPKDFPLTVLAYAAAIEIDPVVANVMNPVFGGLLLLATGALAYQLTGSRAAAVLSGAALLTTISFWMTSGAQVSTDSLGVAAFLAGIVLLLRAGAAGDARWRREAVLAGLVFALSISSRYVVVGPIGVVVLVLWISRRIGFRVVAVTALTAAVALSPVLLYHSWLYDGPLETGYALGDALFKERVRFEGRGLLSFDFGRFTSHLRLYVGRVETLLLIAAALWGVRSARRSADARAVAIASGIIAVALFAYYGGQGTWGSTDFAVNSSLVRYLLPAFALGSVFAGMALARLRGDVLTVGVAAVAVLVAAAVWTTWDGPGGFGASTRAADQQRAVRDWVVDQTPEDAVVVTRLGSKVLFPERRAMSATLMLDGSRVIRDREILVWEVVPTPQELAEDMALMAESGYPTFLYNDGTPGWLTQRQLAVVRDELAERGMELVDRSRPADATLAKVELYEAVRG